MREGCVWKVGSESLSFRMALYLLWVFCCQAYLPSIPQSHQSIRHSSINHIMTLLLLTQPNPTQPPYSFSPSSHRHERGNEDEVGGWEGLSSGWSRVGP
jgi:hypothetical protein